MDQKPADQTEQDEAYIGRSPWIPSTSNQLEPYLSQMQQKQYAAGDIILEAGQPVRNLYYLKQGTVRAMVMNQDGSEKLMFVLTAPHILGEVAAFLGGPSLVYFVAETNCCLYCCTAKQMDGLMEQNPALSKWLICCMAQKTKSLIHQLAGTAISNAEDRFLRLLYVLYTESGYQQDDKVIIPCPLTHQKLADATGLHRVTISNLLSRYRKEQIMEKEKDRLVVQQWDYVLQRVL